jgi:subtilisin family serine protease
VINLSVGSDYSQATNDAVNAAVAANVVCAVAAGNSNRNACNYSPSSAAGALTVGASEIDDSRAYYSNYGTCLDIFAPGTDIRSAYIGNPSSTEVLSGTSMASPHVAGVAAQLRSSESYSSYSAAEINDVILSIATENAISGVNGPNTSPDNISPNLMLYSSCNYTGSGDPSSAVRHATSPHVWAALFGAIIMTVASFLH